MRTRSVGKKKHIEDISYFTDGDDHSGLINKIAFELVINFFLLKSLLILVSQADTRKS